MREAVFGARLREKIAGRQTAAPIGMFVDRARQVWLFDESEHILGRHKRKPRRRACDIGDGAVHNRLGMLRRRISLHAIDFFEGGPKRAPVIVARTPFRFGIAIARFYSKLAPPIDVAPLPPSGYGRQIVRCGRRNGFGTPTRRGHETSMLALEP